MVYKPTNITGGGHPAGVWIIMFSPYDIWWCMLETTEEGISYKHGKNMTQIQNLDPSQFSQIGCNQ